MNSKTNNEAPAEQATKPAEPKLVDVTFKVAPKRSLQFAGQPRENGDKASVTERQAARLKKRGLIA